MRLKIFFKKGAAGPNFRRKNEYDGYTNTNATNDLSLRGAERRSNPMKNKIATPRRAGLAMTTYNVKIFNAFVLTYAILLIVSLLAPSAILGKDKIIIFTGHNDWKPFHFLNQSGNPDGFSVDLINALCQELNLRFEIKLYHDWTQAQKDVADGLADAVIGFARTSEREKYFDFSKKIDAVNMVIAVRKETATVHSLKDLYGSSIAIPEGAPHLEELSKDPRFRVIPVHGMPDGLQKLASQEVMALISDELSIRYVAQYHQIKEIKVVGKPHWEKDYAIGVKKGNKHLLELINSGMALLEKKGVINELKTKWFGSEIKIREFPLWGRYVLGGGILLVVLVGISSLALLTFNKKLKEKVRGQTDELEKANEELKKEIEERKLAEEKYRSIFENVIEGIFQTTPEGRYLNVNPALARLYGYDSPDELINTITDIPHQLYVDSSHRLEAQRLLQEQGVLQNFEAQFYRKDGSIIWVIMNVRAVRDRNGRVAYYEGTAQDITERKRIEEALRESEERYRTAIEYSNDGFSIAKGNINLFVNQKYLEIFGYSHFNEIKEKPISVVVHPDDKERVLEFARKRRMGEEAPPRYEFKGIRKDGSTVYIEVSVTKVTYQKEDLMLAYLRDVTERKKADHLVLIQRDLAMKLNTGVGFHEGMHLCLEAGFQVSGFNSGGIYVFDEDTGVLDLIVHKGLSSEFISGVSRYGPDSMNTKLVMAGKPVYTQFQKLGMPLNDIKWKEGLRAIAVIPIIYENQAVGCLNLASHTFEEVPLSVRNALEIIATQIGNTIYRIRTEEALRESEKQLRYFSSQLLNIQEQERKWISRELHDELGQSLALLKLRISLIKKNLQGDQIELREECEHNLRFIDQVIENVRQISRDLVPSILEDMGLPAALQRMVNDFVNNYDIKVTLGPLEIDHLVSREAQIIIYRIIQEALTNIIKHAQAKNVSMVIKKSGDHISFSIEDDGKGFNVREAFMKGAAGKGLGLSTMNERARMLGGSLNLRSQEGKGTRVTFSIPTKKGGGLS